MKFSTSVSLINRNTGHKSIHNDMGKVKVDKSNNKTLTNFPWVLYPNGNPQNKKVWVPSECYVMTYLHVSHFITGERMQSVLCVDTHHFSCKEKLLVCARSNVTAEKFANKTSKIPLLTPLLRHKAGQEGRGEILLENSFMR